MPTLDSLCIIFSYVEDWTELGPCLLTSRLFNLMTVRLPLYKRYVQNIKPHAFMLKTHVADSLHYACLSNNIDVLTFLSQRKDIVGLEKSIEQRIEEIKTNNPRVFTVLKPSTLQSFSYFMIDTIKGGSARVFWFLLKEFHSVIEQIMKEIGDETRLIDLAMEGGNCEIIRYVCETYNIPQSYFVANPGLIKPAILISSKLEPKAFDYLVNRYSIDVDEIMTSLSVQFYYSDNIDLYAHLIRRYESCRNCIEAKNFFSIKFFIQYDRVEMISMIIREMNMSKDTIIDKVARDAYRVNSTKIIAYLERSILV